MMNSVRSLCGRSPFEDCVIASRQDSWLCRGRTPAVQQQHLCDSVSAQQKKGGSKTVQLVILGP